MSLTEGRKRYMCIYRARKRNEVRVGKRADQKRAYDRKYYRVCRGPRPAQPDMPF